MMIKLLFTSVLFTISTVSLQACHADNPPLTPPQEVTLHFGHQGVRDFYAYTHGTSDDYPEIMSFYELDWSLDNLGTIHLNHFDSTTTISNVSWAMGTKNSRHTHGIGNLTIHADLSKTQYATAEQAYQDYVALITAFKKAGWQQYFEPWNARIAKEDNLKILTHRNPFDVPDDMFVFNVGHSSDSLTPLTFKEWQYVIAEQKKDGFGFSLNLDLYLRDINVWINISPFDTKPNPIPSQPDLVQYQVDYTFNTAKYNFYKNIIDEKNSEQLRQEYEEWRNWEIESRQDYETRAKNAGFRINEDYQDPDMWQYIIEPAY